MTASDYFRHPEPEDEGPDDPAVASDLAVALEAWDYSDHELDPDADCPDCGAPAGICGCEVTS